MGFLLFFSLFSSSIGHADLPSPGYIDYGYARGSCVSVEDYGIEIRHEEQSAKVEFGQLVVKSELDARVCLYVLREDGTEDRTRVALRAIPYEKYWIDKDAEGKIVHAQTTKVPEARLEAPEFRKVWPVNMTYEAVQSLKWLLPLSELLTETQLRQLEKEGRMVEVELDFCYHRFGTIIDSKNAIVPIVALCEATKRLYEIRKKPNDKGYEINMRVLLHPRAKQKTPMAPLKNPKDEVLEGLKF
jgi:hypothetical protein